jgi:phosphate transport system permease protein
VFVETHLVRRKLRTQLLVTIVFAAMALCALLPLACILAYLFVNALPALSLGFLTEFPQRNNTAGGVFPALVGTFYTVGLSLLVATPIGILAAVYLNEYARDNWFTRIVNLAVLNLAGVPSIVHALFGLAAFVGLFGKPCLLAASLTLAVMTLPVIIASTKQALESVPMAFREACWNLGATRWQVVRSIVLPNSISGILTGIILQVSRAAGETAPIIFTGATLTKRDLPASLMDQTMTMSYHLWAITTQGSKSPREVQCGTAVVLLGLVLVLNAASILLRIYFRSRKKW